LQSCTLNGLLKFSAEIDVSTANIMPSPWYTMTFIHILPNKLHLYFVCHGLLPHRLSVVVSVMSVSGTWRAQPSSWTGSLLANRSVVIFVTFYYRLRAKGAQPNTFKKCNRDGCTSVAIVSLLPGLVGGSARLLHVALLFLLFHRMNRTLLSITNHSMYCTWRKIRRLVLRNIARVPPSLHPSHTALLLRLRLVAGAIHSVTLFLPSDIVHTYLLHGAESFLRS
jgi:hypothetical protein